MNLNPSAWLGSNLFKRLSPSSSGKTFRNWPEDGQIHIPVKLIWFVGRRL